MVLNIFSYLGELLFDENGNTKPIVKITLAIILFISIALLTFFSIKREKKLSNRVKTKQLIFLALLSGISYLLYVFRFNLPFFLFFLDVHFANVPVLIGGFLLGPISGSLIVFVRTFLKILTQSTSTAYIGELADLIIGIVTVFVSSLIYHRNKTKKGAVKALILASTAWILTATLINWLFIVDFYIYAILNGNPSMIIGALNTITKSTIANENNFMIYYLFIGIIPFNIFVSTLVSFITFIIYKRISKLAQSFYKDELKN